MYYGLIILSVLMFGGCFKLQDVYRGLRGSGVRISLDTSFIGAIAAVILLFVINGFRIEFTPFTLIMAALASLNSIGFTFCTLKALERIDLSLFSLFSMLGGMVLPFLQGIIFYKEGLTLAKILCLIFIGAALFLTVTRGNGRGGAIYYVGIFVLNGMSGVLSKIFTESRFEKTSGTSYSLWIAVITALISGVLILSLSGRLKRAESRITVGAVGASAANGAIYQLANLLLVIALSYVDASVQYPMVTGGVIIVSTLICFFEKEKPSKKEMLAVLLSFVGMLLLFAVPI